MGQQVKAMTNFDIDRERSYGRDDAVYFPDHDKSPPSRDPEVARRLWETIAREISYKIPLEGARGMLVAALLFDILEGDDRESQEFLEKRLPNVFWKADEGQADEFLQEHPRRDRWGEIITPEEQAEMDAEDFKWRHRPNPDYPYPPLGGPMPARSIRRSVPYSQVSGRAGQGSDQWRWDIDGNRWVNG